MHTRREVLRALATKNSTWLNALNARAAWKRAILTAVITATGLLGNASPQVSSPKAVAVLEVGAPELQAFTLRGTVPVPRGVFPRADGHSPFAVLDWDGTPVPAQVEAVTYYPGNKRIVADVVEVLARVHTPPGTQVGDRLKYSVISSPNPTIASDLTPAVSRLLSTNGALVLMASDVFGNPYSAHLMRGLDGKKPLRQGRWATQQRNYEVMRPNTSNLGPPNGALPHLMGVHAYVTTWEGEDLISIDLRVHNGSSGHDKADPIDDAMADLYFRSLELRVPKGWVVFHDWVDPFAGSRTGMGPWTFYPIVKPNSDGTPHLLPAQSQFHRRLVIAPSNNRQRARSLLSEHWLGFCSEGKNASGERLWSWWNPRTARYWPQRHRLPDLDHIGGAAIRGNLFLDLAKVSDAIETGLPNGGPIHGSVLGWAHPWGVPYGGQTGGTEIYLYDGIEVACGASQRGYQLAQLTLRSYIDRHPITLYNKDGNPTRLADWLIQGPGFVYVDMQFFLQLLSGPDPFGFSKAPKFQSDYVEQNSLEPPYASELWSFKPIDLQHTIRISRSAKTLAWLGNDALAKDELMMQAEVARLSYHYVPNSPGGASIASGMLTDIQQVAANPGTGFGIGRQEGWIIDSMSAAYSVADPAWRMEADPWFDQVTTLVRDGQMNCSGFLQRITSSKTINGLFQARKSTEGAILENALWGALNTVYRGARPGMAQILRDVLTKHIYATFTFPSWSLSLKAPWNAIAVAPLGTTNTFCGTVPHLGTTNGVDKFQCWSSFAYGYELTGDAYFINKVAEMAKTQDLLKHLEGTKTKNLENRAALLALVQQFP